MANFQAAKGNRDVGVEYIPVGPMIVGQLTDMKGQFKDGFYRGFQSIVAIKFRKQSGGKITIVCPRNVIDPTNEKQIDQTVKATLFRLVHYCGRLQDDTRISGAFGKVVGRRSENAEFRRNFLIEPSVDIGIKVRRRETQRIRGRVTPFIVRRTGRNRCRRVT